MIRLAERPGFVPPPELAAIRAGMAKARAEGRWRSDPPALEIDLGGIRALRFGQSGASRATLLHIHGGGFRIGLPEQVATFAAALSLRCGIDVVCPAYRLAPDHPFPAALNDVRHAWDVLRRETAAPIMLSGDSAGGGLAASLTSIAVAGGAAPQGLVLLSPWLDLTITSECFERNAATDALFSRAAAEQAAAFYLQGADPRDPLASPLFADPSGFPPTFVAIGKGEVLADDGRRFGAALATAGIAVTLLEVDGMEHVAVTGGLDRTGALETFDALTDYIDRLEL